MPEYNTKQVIVGGLVLVSALVAWRQLVCKQCTKGKSQEAKVSKAEFKNVLIGDIGGTNIRFQLLRLRPGQGRNECEVLKSMQVFKPKFYNSLEACLTEYLEGLSADQKPHIGVVGMAGPVQDNGISVFANIQHWKAVNGDKIAQDMGFEKFTFINDFLAAGYGVSTLEDDESKPILDSANAKLQEGARSVKLVLGPGTGLGQGLLVKLEENGLYEPLPTEGGHVDFTVQTQEDWDLVCFARKFIETSDNVENKRAKAQVGRMSVERLGAGPAVPLLYAFMKEKHPELEAVIEKAGKKFDDIESKDIIIQAIEHKDPLCMKVVEKFAQIFGNETGNMALKTLPYGGIYLIGGVTNGIRSYLLGNQTFLSAFKNKGRLAPVMNSFQVRVMDADIEIGLRGCQELARREMLKYQ